MTTVRKEERTPIREHIIEIVSDSGEGAQKAGQTLGAVCAKMGCGVWTVEIIPAEIKPPARSRAGASGIRVRTGAHKMTNMGDEANLVVAFNEQVLYGRITQGAFRPGTIILLERKWADDPVGGIREDYAESVKMFRDRGLVVHELDIETACRELTPTPKVGKNMFVLGMLCQLYGLDPQLARDEIALIFGRKGDKVVRRNHELLDGGYAYAADSVPYSWKLLPRSDIAPQVVMNGNQAVGLGVMAAGIEFVSMYPITPATSVTHYLARAFPRVGGFVHQAEDEIAAIGVAIGAAFAGKTPCTITSGPGMALKTEFIGYAVMAELPLVIVVVQRGGPSTGLPTKVEQGDLLAALFGAPGDAPKIVIAAATIEECFHLVVTCRSLAEAFRTPVILLTDANLATGVAPFERPELSEAWLAPPLDLSPWKEGLDPYAWDDETGLAPRPIPGQRGGEHTVTGLAHTEQSKVAYDPQSNQRGCEMRSLKLDTLRKTLNPPTINGDSTGDLLIVGWGSTLGSIDEAVERARAEGIRVSSIHLRFVSPLEPGLAEIFAGFRKVMTVEINYSDSPKFGASRRLSQLAYILRAETLVDVDCWSEVRGQPLRPGEVYNIIVENAKPAGKPVSKMEAQRCSV